ncbi:MAG: IS3 family transposase, partial [Candidatus Promineifilaceae bacterium]
AGQYPVQALCRVLKYPRSSYYYAAVAPKETALQAALEAVAAQWPTYGYRRLTRQLRRQGWLVNHKPIQGLMRQMGLQARRPSRQPRTTGSRHSWPRFPNLVQGWVVEQPEQLWVGDITYIRLQRDFVFLAILMDVFSRGIRGWHLGRELDQTLTLTALERALIGRQPHIHHSDQGVQYAAAGYVARLQAAAVAISMAEVGQAWQNGYAERLIRTIKEEEVNLTEYRDYQDAYRQLGRFLDDVYNHKRIHSSLGYLTPAEFESQWLLEQVMADR